MVTAVDHFSYCRPRPIPSPTHTQIVRAVEFFFMIGSDTPMVPLKSYSLFLFGVRKWSYPQPLGQPCPNPLRTWAPFPAFSPGVCSHHFSLWDTKKTGAAFQDFQSIHYSPLCFEECWAEATWAQTLMWGHKWFFTLAVGHPTHRERKRLKRTMASLYLMTNTVCFFTSCWLLDPWM